MNTKKSLWSLVTHRFRQAKGRERASQGAGEKIKGVQFGKARIGLRLFNAEGVISVFLNEQVIKGQRGTHIVDACHMGGGFVGRARKLGVLSLIADCTAVLGLPNSACLLPPYRI